MAALIARAAAARRADADTFEVWGSLDTVRDLLYVTDQIDAVIAADATFQDTIVNCTPNAPVTIGQCAEAIMQALSWDARIVQPPGSFQGAGYKSLDSGRFLAATDWRPRITADRGRAPRAGSEFRRRQRAMMTVSRTPLRVSFFGGGTDYPEYYERARGAVLGMAIDKYVYISALRLSSVIDYHYRVSYSRIETVSACARPAASGGAQRAAALRAVRSAGSVHHGRPAGAQRARQLVVVHRRTDQPGACAAEAADHQVGSGAHRGLRGARAVG